MNIDSATWLRITTLFDELADLSTAERQRYLDEAAPPDEIRRYLERLLAAHDAPNPLLLDQPVDDIVAGMLGEAGQAESVIPGNLEGRRFDKWQAGSELGRGGMSVVLTGHRADGQFEKTVAIKLLPPGPVGAGRRDDFLREVRLLAQLEHPGIVRLLDGGVSEDDIPYLVMERVDGQPITRYCEENGLSLKQRVRLFLKVTEAVAYSHRHLVVHCDIKPSNVLVNRDGQVKLLDFGIASLLPESDEKARRRPALRCSPAYAAPEQLDGEPPAVSQDVFSLGALLYELLCGHRIRSLKAVTSVLLGRRLPDDWLPPSARVSDNRRNRSWTDLDAICLKALASTPRNRYDDVGALETDLEHWLNERPVLARAGGRIYRTGKWFRRYRWSAAFAGLAAVGLIFGSGLALWHADQAERSALLALAEAERAETALAETRQALRRAEALQEFLLGLFRAARPDRPRGELPSTEELLEHGARQAMNEDRVPAEERLGMLLAISGVYVSLNRYDDAEPLVNTAVSLARRQAEERPADLSRALRQKAQVIREPSTLDEAEALLMEAESLVAGAEAHWNLYALARIHRAWVERHRRDYEAAWAILQPLFAELGLQGEQVTPRVRTLLLDSLAGVASALGYLDEAAEYRRQASDAVRVEFGSDSRRYAVSLANGASLQRQLGRFDEAELRAREAIALYDRIFDQPMDYRAAARRSLARILMARGDYDQGLKTLEASGREWAEFAGRALEDWEYYYLTSGSFRGRIGRIEEGIRELQHARALIIDRGEDPHALNLVDALLGWLHCRNGNEESGEAALRALEGRVGSEFTGDPRFRAYVQEARAVCALADGRLEAALEYIDVSLESHAVQGDVLERVDRRLVRSHILAELGHHGEAGRELVCAESLLETLGLASHPMMVTIQQLRRELPDGHI